MTNDVIADLNSQLVAVRKERDAFARELAANRACNLFSWKKRAEAAERARDAAISANRSEFEGHKLTIADHRLEVAALTTKIQDLEAEVYAVREAAAEWRERATKLHGA